MREKRQRRKTEEIGEWEKIYMRKGIESEQKR